MPEPDETTETIDGICGELEIYQAKNGYRFGVDSVLLAGFMQPGGKRLVDLGCGSGVIALIMAHFGRVERAVGVEIQPQLVQRARRSAAHNHLSDRVEILEGDLKDLTKLLPAGRFDRVLSNPPYRTVRSGNLSQGEERAQGRHEILCKLEDVVKTAARLLQHRGLFGVVFPPGRLTELLGLCDAHGLRPSRLRLVHGRPDMPSKTCLLEAMRAGRMGLKVEPPLILYGPNGQYTPEVQALLYPNSGPGH